MGMLGQLELAARVAAGLVVIVAPTLLFLLLWHGLEAMRDDELVQRARRRAETMEQGGSPFDFVPTASGSPDVRCPHCGAGNRDEMQYCQQCLSRLD